MIEEREREREGEQRVALNVNNEWFEALNGKMKMEFQEFFLSY